MLTAKAGDLILAHHQIFHAGGPNVSPNVRYAVISRLRHKDCDEVGYDAIRIFGANGLGYEKYLKREVFSLTDQSDKKWRMWQPAPLSQPVKFVYLS